MTIGQLRQILFATWLLGAVAAFVHDTSRNAGMPFFGLAVVIMIILFIPTVRIGRIRGETPLAGLGLAAPSVVVFVLGITAPLLLLVHAVPAVAAWVGLVAAYLWFDRAARAALSAQSEALHVSGGDKDFGVFTALTPMAGPPTTRPEPTSQPTHTRYDPAAARDPLAEITRPPGQGTDPRKGSQT